MKSFCSNLNPFLYPPCLISLPQPSQGNLDLSSGAPGGPHQNPDTTQDTRDTDSFSLTWLWMVKIMLWRPPFILIPTQAYKSISPIPRDPESHFWGPRGLHHSSEKTLCALYTASFSLIWHLILPNFSATWKFTLVRLYLCFIVCGLHELLET